MIGWIVRGLMVAAGIIAGWFVARDEPIFGTVQIMVALLLMVLIVAAIAFWPSRWPSFWPSRARETHDKAAPAERSDGSD